MTNVAMHTSAPTPHAPPPPRRKNDVPLWWILIAVVVMLAMGFGAYSFYNAEFGKKPKPSYPAHWDARIAPFAKIAERQRGLYFLHPVAVRFLEPKAFEKTVTSDESGTSKKEQAAYEQQAGVMRALGMFAGNVDLEHATNEESGSSTLAYYSFDDQTITIRGTRILPSVRRTLVHELTHALQDQRYQIGEKLQRIAKGDSGDASVLRAVIEGDAERTADRYVASLPARVRKSVEAGQSHEIKEAQARRSQVPDALTTLMSAPYVLGQGLVTAVSIGDGNSGVDKLLRTPPRHDFVLLDPVRVLEGDTKADEVARPKVAKAEKKLQSGELGAVGWFLMLSEKIPVADALLAADGWGGDSYVAVVKGGVSCVRASYVGHVRADTDTMYTALRRWAATPGTKTSVSRSGGTVSFESCDPGKAAAKRIHGHSFDALQLAANRQGLEIQLIRGKLTPQFAQCFSTRAVTQYSAAELAMSLKEFESDPTRVQRRADIAAACKARTS